MSTPPVETSAELPSSQAGFEGAEQAESPSRSEQGKTVLFIPS